MIEKIRKFYKDILSSAWIEVKDDFYLYSKINKDKKIKEGDKYLVFPTNEVLEKIKLNSDEIKKWEVFNPLKEDKLRPESKSIKRLRSNFNVIYNLKLMLLFNHILNVLGDDKLSKEKFIINLVSNLKITVKNYKNLVDEKTLHHFHLLNEELMKKSNYTKGIIHFYIKRGGKLNNKRYDRIAVVSFPLYNFLKELKDSDRVFNKEKLRVKDIELFMSVLEYMFPDCKDGDIQFGLIDEPFPSLKLLISMVITYGERINELMDEFKYFELNNIDKEDEEGYIKLDWIDDWNYLIENENMIKESLEITTNEQKEDNVIPPWEEQQNTNINPQPIYNNQPQVQHSNTLNPAEIARQNVFNQPIHNQVVQQQHTHNVQQNKNMLSVKDITNNPMLNNNLQQPIQNNMQQQFYQNQPLQPNTMQQPMYQHNPYNPGPRQIPVQVPIGNFNNFRN